MYRKMIANSVALTILYQMQVKLSENYFIFKSYILRDPQHPTGQKSPQANSVEKHKSRTHGLGSSDRSRKKERIAR
jgi:hypothetical protein